MSIEYSFAVMMSAVRQDLPVLMEMIKIIAHQPLLKGAVLSALLVAAFCKTGLLNKRVDNIFALRAATAIFASILMARLFQRLLPHRDRPINMLSDADIGEGYIHSSAFPSDHAVLMTVIACIIFARDRTLGVVAAMWAVFIIFLPRMYLGLHHPTDIIGGVLFGLLVWHLVRVAPVPKSATTVLETARRDHKAVTAFFAFLFLFLMSTNFEGLRSVAHFTLSSLFGVDIGL